MAVHPPLTMNSENIKEVEHHKHLGIYISHDGTWHEHINYITAKAWQRICIMRKLKVLLDRDSLQIIYIYYYKLQISFICHILEYADIVWDNSTQYELNALEKIQIEAARIVTGTTKLISVNLLYQEIGLEPLTQRRTKHKLHMFYKMSNDLSPAYLSSPVPSSFGNTAAYSLRDSQNIRPVLPRTQLYYKSFIPSRIREWNELQFECRNSDSLTIFKHQLNKDLPKIPNY